MCFRPSAVNSSNSQSIDKIINDNTNINNSINQTNPYEINDPIKAFGEIANPAEVTKIL